MLTYLKELSNAHPRKTKCGRGEKAAKKLILSERKGSKCTTKFYEYIELQSKLSQVKLMHSKTPSRLGPFNSIPRCSFASLVINPTDVLLQCNLNQ